MKKSNCLFGVASVLLGMAVLTGYGKTPVYFRLEANGRTVYEKQIWPPEEEHERDYFPSIYSSDRFDYDTGNYEKL